MKKIKQILVVLIGISIIGFGLSYAQPNIPKESIPYSESTGLEKNEIRKKIEITKENYLSFTKSYPELNEFEKKFKQRQISEPLKDWWSKLIIYSREWSQKGRPRLIVGFVAMDSFAIPIEKKVESSQILRFTETKVIVRDKGNGPEYSGRIQVRQSSLEPQIWDFGARHNIDGKVSGWPSPGFSIESDPKSPLSFTVMGDGVFYDGGVGILEVKDGPIILLGVGMQEKK